MPTANPTYPDPISRAGHLVGGYFDDVVLDRSSLTVSVKAFLRPPAKMPIPTTDAKAGTAQYKTTVERRLIIDVLDEAGEPMQLSDVAFAVGKTSQNVSNMLTGMADKGHLAAVFVLDMGEPVRILDLARRLSAALRPGMPLQIQEVGLRQGEKLHEVLFHDSDDSVEKPHDRIWRCRVEPLNPAALGQEISPLGLAKLIAQTDSNTGISNEVKSEKLPRRRRPVIDVAGGRMHL